MSESPFAFLRGAAAVMAADLATVPNTGLRVQACGDAHVNNFRFFASPERNLVFDINDFDETAPGPWEWDIARLCASLRVMTDQRGWSDEDGDAVVRMAARSYRRRLAEYATWTTLDLFYERTEIKHVIDRFPTQYRAEVRRDVRRARRKDHIRAVAKLTTMKAGSRVIVEDPPLTVGLHRTSHELDEVHGLIESYRETLSDDRRLMFDRYRLLDVARKVVGVGSVGTRCWIGLFEGRDDPTGDLIVLQAKQAVASVLERHVGASEFDHHGRRVVVGQRLVQAAGDVFLGWAARPRNRQSVLRATTLGRQGQSRPDADEAPSTCAIQRTLRLDTRQITCTHRRRGADFGLPRQEQEMGQRDGHLRRALRRHHDGRPRSVDRFRRTHRPRPPRVCGALVSTTQRG